MASDNYNLNLDEIISTDNEEFERILKKVARSVGIGYEQIWDNISSDSRAISLGELVDIAKKVKEAIDTYDENVEIDEATANFIKTMKESFYDNKDNHPF